MKKIFALVVMLCVVMISSSVSAATMPKWEFVKDEIIVIPPDPNYSLTPEQYYWKEYKDLIRSGLSPRRARRVAENMALEYQADYEAERLKNMNQQPQKLSSYYIDLNSIEADQTNESGAAFHVIIMQLYTSFGREDFIASLRKNGDRILDEYKKLSFIIAKVHFKSTNGITKYFTITDMIPFTTDGNPIEAATVRNLPFNWQFINPGNKFDLIFNAAYRYL